MKKVTLALLFFVTVFILPSCKKEGAAPSFTGDFMIMGHAGGFVGPGATTPYYLLTSTELRKDTTVLVHTPPVSNAGFNFNYLYDAVAFARVAYLRNEIPAELLKMNGADIGTYWPDAGYLEVRTSLGGANYVWYFEAGQENSSAAIRTFVDRVNQIAN